MRTGPDSRVCKSRSNRLLFRDAFTAILFLAAFACLAQGGQDRQPVPPVANAHATPNPGTSSTTDNAAQLTVQQKTADADTERKKQITSDSSQLLTMAIALKAEVDKTNKDTLSLNVIRKADEIEKLAHTVKGKIKQGTGPG
jgi:hypothetical protein